MPRRRRKHVLDPKTEHLGYSERQGQRRIGAPGLDRVDALPRYAQLAGKIGLGQAFAAATNGDTVLHDKRTLHKSSIRRNGKM